MSQLCASAGSRTHVSTGEYDECFLDPYGQPLRRRGLRDAARGVAHRVAPFGSSGEDSKSNIQPPSLPNARNDPVSVMRNAAPRVFRPGQNARAVFQAFDSAQTGTVTFSGASTALRRLGLDLSRDYIEAMAKRAGAVTRLRAQPAAESLRTGSGALGQGQEPGAGGTTGSASAGSSSVVSAVPVVDYRRLLGAIQRAEESTWTDGATRGTSGGGGLVFESGSDEFMGSRAGMGPRLGSRKKAPPGLRAAGSQLQASGAFVPGLPAVAGAGAGAAGQPTDRTGGGEREAEYGTGASPVVGEEKQGQGQGQFAPWAAEARALAPGSVTGSARALLGPFGRGGPRPVSTGDALDEAMRGPLDRESSRPRPERAGAAFRGGAPGSPLRYGPSGVHAHHDGDVAAVRGGIAGFMAGRGTGVGRGGADEFVGAGGLTRPGGAAAAGGILSSGGRSTGGVEVRKPRVHSEAQMKALRAGMGGAAFLLRAVQRGTGLSSAAQAGDLVARALRARGGQRSRSASEGAVVPLGDVVAVLERCGARLSQGEVAAAAKAAGAASGLAFVRAQGLETALVGAGRMLDAQVGGEGESDFGALDSGSREEEVPAFQADQEEEEPAAQGRQQKGPSRAALRAPQSAGASTSGAEEAPVQAAGAPSALAMRPVWSEPALPGPVTRTGGSPHVQLHAVHRGDNGGGAGGQHDRASDVPRRVLGAAEYQPVSIWRQPGAEEGVPFLGVGHAGAAEEARGREQAALGTLGEDSDHDASRDASGDLPDEAGGLTPAYPQQLARTSSSSSTRGPLEQVLPEPPVASLQPVAEGYDPTVSSAAAQQQPLPAHVPPGRPVGFLKLRGAWDTDPSRPFAGAPSLPLHASGRGAGSMAPPPPAARPEAAESMKMLQDMRVRAAAAPQERWGVGRAVPLPGTMDPGRLLRLRIALRRSLPVTSKAAEQLLRRKLRAQDGDGDGVLSHVELGQALASAGLRVAPVDALRLVAAFDGSLSQALGGAGQPLVDASSSTKSRDRGGAGKGRRGQGKRRKPIPHRRHRALEYAGYLDLDNFVDWVVAVPGGHGLEGWQGSDAWRWLARVAGDGVSAPGVGAGGTESRDMMRSRGAGGREDEGGYEEEEEEEDGDGSEADGRLKWQGREWRLAQFRLKWIERHGEAARIEAARDDMRAAQAPGPSWKGARGNRKPFKVLRARADPPSARDVGRRAQASREARARGDAEARARLMQGNAIKGLTRD